MQWEPRIVARGRTKPRAEKTGGAVVRLKNQACVFVSGIGSPRSARARLGIVVPRRVYSKAPFTAVALSLAPPLLNGYHLRVGACAAPIIGPASLLFAYWHTMGRNKIPIQKIPNERNRQVCLN